MEITAARYESMVAALGHPEVRPIIDRVCAFDQANEAFEYFGKTGRIGKVVMRVGG